ncbi:MAG: prefoldin subunit alpha [Candidatus Aenigmarchaeota archaeon]|nr:prefoldin subunit alpha [Candidatus Aenigmarchaeota archaeon]
MTETDNNKENINELVATYNFLENQLKALLEQKNRYSIILEDLKATKESIDNIEIYKENYINIGSVVGVPVKIENDKFLVNIGSGVMVELTKEKAAKFVEERMEFVKKEMIKIDEIINVYQNKLNDIAIKVQELSSKTK